MGEPAADADRRRRRPHPPLRGRRRPLRRAPARRRCRTGSTASTSCSTAPTAPPPAVSPEVFTDAGATVTVIGADPDGININDGVGSTHLDNLAEAVLEHGADVGIAHDGDADRCLAVDADGAVIDGDQIMAILALAAERARRARRRHARRDRHEQPRPAAAPWRDHGIRWSQTGVGDRYVLEEMNEHGYSLGGEQSGHIVFAEYATTGDGILTGLHLVAEHGGARARPLAELAAVDDGLPADPDQRARRRPHARSRPTRCSPPPWPPPRTSSATPAACCCARRAPSRSCASWSRPPTKRRRPCRPRAGRRRPGATRLAATCVPRTDAPPPGLAIGVASVRSCGAGPDDLVVGALAQHERRTGPGRQHVLDQVRLVDGRQMPAAKAARLLLAHARRSGGRTSAPW